MKKMLKHSKQRKDSSLFSSEKFWGLLHHSKKKIKKKNKIRLVLQCLPGWITWMLVQHQHPSLTYITSITKDRFQFKHKNCRLAISATVRLVSTKFFEFFNTLKCSIKIRGVHCLWTNKLEQQQSKLSFYLEDLMIASLCRPQKLEDSVCPSILFSSVHSCEYRDRGGDQRMFQLLPLIMERI